MPGETGENQAPPEGSVEELFDNDIRRGIDEEISGLTSELRTSIAVILEVLPELDIIEKTILYKELLDFIQALRGQVKEMSKVDDQESREP